MDNRKGYLGRLKSAIEDIHQCIAVHRKSVPVSQKINGAVWRGKVEVFELKNHSKSIRCYAWQDQGGTDFDGEAFVIVLELGSIRSARSAVRAAMGKN
jgi:hypothetical protein